MEVNKTTTGKRVNPNTPSEYDSILATALSVCFHILMIVAGTDWAKNTNWPTLGAGSEFGFGPCNGMETSKTRHVYQGVPGLVDLKAALNWQRRLTQVDLLCRSLFNLAAKSVGQYFFGKVFMAQTDFLCCALSCACLMKFATSCSWHILRQVR